jgi:hypothetical protein
MLRALIVLLALFPTMSRAEYTCSDRDSLRSILDELDRSCGSSDYCTIRHNGETFVGKNAESAVSDCMRSYNRNSCIGSLSCTSAVTYCSVTYNGDRFLANDAVSAVAACQGFYNRNFCVTGLTCQGRARYCTISYNGERFVDLNAEDTVAECQRYYNRNSCASNLTCR